MTYAVTVGGSVSTSPGAGLANHSNLVSPAQLDSPCSGTGSFWVSQVEIIDQSGGGGLSAVASVTFTSEFSAGDTVAWTLVNANTIRITSISFGDGNQSKYSASFAMFDGSSTFISNVPSSGVFGILGCATRTKTQSSKARATSITTKDQTGKSRVTLPVARTQSALAEILGFTDRTQSAKADIRNASNQDQLGIGRLIDRTDLGFFTNGFFKSNFYSPSFFRRPTGNRTMQGQSRIAQLDNRTQLATSKITFTHWHGFFDVGIFKSTFFAPIFFHRTSGLKTIQGRFRITAHGTQAQAARAFVILAQDGFFSNGLFRTGFFLPTFFTINASRKFATQTGKGAIKKDTSQAQTGKGSLVFNTDQVQTGKSALRTGASQDQHGKTRVTALSDQAQPGKGNIFATSDQDQSGKSRVTNSATKAQTGESRIEATADRDQQGKASVSFGLTQDRTQPGKGSIFLTDQKDIPGRSRIQGTVDQGQSGRADIIHSLVEGQDQPGIGRIDRSDPCDCDPTQPTVMFIYQALVLEVKNPELGDVRGVLAPLKVLTMMDGTLRTRRDASTPVKMVLEFTELSRSKSLEMRDFIVATTGKVIDFQDWTGSWWRGRLVVEPTMLTTLSRGGGSSSRKESSSIKVTFEGTRT